jgi:general L-amino acid transport system permease protein
VGLSFNLSPEGPQAALGNLVLFLTNGALLTSLVVILWLAGAVAVIYGAMRRHWPGPVEWLKDSLYSDFFGALTTLLLSLIIVFSIRAVLSWAVFGAEFRSDPDSVALLKDVTPGAIWGVIFANTKFFAVGQYPNEAIWRVWASLMLVVILSALSALAWGFGSPLKKLRKALVWAWLASMFFIYWFLGGINDQSTGLLQEVPTNYWGGFLLTVIITVFGIVLSFPLGVALALGRRSETRGVPLLWLWGAILLILFWLFFGFPSEPKTLNIPILFRDPPIWTVTLSPLAYAALQALIVVGICWIIGYYLGGNLIKTFSIVFIEVIRGVPFITILFMANVMIPIFLPKEIEIVNLFRVMVVVIIFTAAYLA